MLQGFALGAYFSPTYFVYNQATNFQKINLAYLLRQNYLQTMGYFGRKVLFPSMMIGAYTVVTFNFFYHLIWQNLWKESSNEYVKVFSGSYVYGYLFLGYFQPQQRVKLGLFMALLGKLTRNPSLFEGKLRDEEAHEHRVSSPLPAFG